MIQDITTGKYHGTNDGKKIPAGKKSCPIIPGKFPENIGEFIYRTNKATDIDKNVMNFHIVLKCYYVVEHQFINK